MLILQGVRISTFSLLHSYFDFKELYKLLCSDENSYIFYDFCRNDLKSLKDKLVWNYVVGQNTVYGTPNQHTGMGRFIISPEKCLEMEMEGQLLFNHCEAKGPDRQQYVEVNNAEIFAEKMITLFQQACCVLDPDKYNFKDIIKGVEPPSWVELRNAVRNAVMDLTEKGHRQFTYQAATELYVYFLLHALAAVLPNNQDSMAVIKQDLAKLCPVSSAARSNQKSFVLQANQFGHAEVPLLYYKGITNRGELLSVIELKNDSDKPVLVKIKDTISIRHLRAKESLYALRKGDQIVGFLPRFRMRNQIVTYYSAGKLFNSFDGRREGITTSIRKPVVWADNDEFGTFIIDQEGNMDQMAAWPDVIPEKPIVLADAFGLDYCMLLHDGKTVNEIRKQGWDDNPIIMVNLSINSAVAIDELRRPVLDTGKIIDGIQAIDARTYNAHYICLDENGQIITDSDLRVFDTVYAIAICSRGYVVAYNGNVCLYDYQNTLQKEWAVSGVTEMEADERQIAYFDGKTGEVKFLKM